MAQERVRSFWECGPLSVVVLSVLVTLSPWPTTTRDPADAGVLVRTADRDCGERPSQSVASFAVAFHEQVSPYRLISAFVLPGQTLSLSAIGEGRFSAEADAGKLARQDDHAWRWTAPMQPGARCIRVREVESGETIAVRAFVMVPWDGRDALNGYRIGRYGADSEAYPAPRGFVEVTEALRDTWLSPHFQLGQFLCKQSGRFPKYLALQTPLLLKLEELLARVNERGIRARTFHVMSGYRTPAYNRAIGNRTTYSRHLYGDAADIFIDESGDGRMDDLDGDGRITAADARILYDIVEEMEGEGAGLTHVGGLGLYPPASHRGPFVHVDTRGQRARW